MWLSRQWARKDVRLCRRAGNEDPPVHPVLGQGKSRTLAGELQAGSAPPQAAPPLLCLQCALCGHGGCEPHLPTSPPSCCTSASRACSHLHSLLFCGHVIFSPLALLLFGDVQCKSTELNQTWVWHLTEAWTTQVPGLQGPL